MNKISTACLLLLSLMVMACHDNEDDYVPLTAEEGEQYSGGSSTVANATEEAFGFASSQLNAEEDTDFGVGNSLFRQSWVTAPSSTTARDGLGPFFNATSCSGCHFKDGRGRAPAYDGELGTGLLLRLSIAGTDGTGASLPDPIYGHQLQDNSIIGPIVKGHIGITYQTITETFDDGTIVQLQKPIYSIANLGYGALASDIKISPRVANQIVGLGLLEAIPEATLLSFASSLMLRALLYR